MVYISWSPGLRDALSKLLQQMQAVRAAGPSTMAPGIQQLMGKPHGNTAAQSEPRMVLGSLSVTQPQGKEKQQQQQEKKCS